MLKRLHALVSASSILVLIVVGLTVHRAYGAQNSCVAAFSTTIARPNDQVGDYLQVNNTGDDPIQWVKITSPSSGDFVIINSSGDSSWGSSSDNTTATYVGGNINPGDAANQFYFTFQAGPNKTAPQAWTVEASSDLNGVGAVTCDDQGLDVAIDDGAPPVITDVNVAELTSTSATITWTTDIPSSSAVDYGRTNQYGSQTSGADSEVNHTVILNSLSPNTAIHFRVESADSVGNVGTSGDNTFLTPIIPNQGGGSDKVSASVGVFSSPISVVVTSPSDKTPPKIAFTNLPSAKIFKTAPTFTGQASDDVSLQRIEYSTDGGKDWLPVDSAPGLNTANTKFSFTPQNLDDGNYKILARAIDAGANITNTATVVAVIDRLPPTVGGSLLSFGPQVLIPDKNGEITSVAGVDQKITFSAVGGPTSITLNALIKGAHRTAQTYNLTWLPDTGLWTGIISFTAPGQYSLVSNAVDGAGNRTSQSLGQVNVDSPAQTTSKTTHRPLTSKVTLYYLEPTSNSWVVWDSSSYGQINPQTTDKHGNFRLFVPPGKYYLKATAAGYETLISSIFETSQTEPLTNNLVLRPLRQLSLGPLHLSFPTLSVQKISLSNKDNTGQSSRQSSLIGKPLPNFTLNDVNGNVVHTADLLGKPLLITLGSSWSPTMTEQLATLNKLQANKDLNIVPIALQEGAGKIRAYSSIAGLGLNWLVDPDSTLSRNYGSPSLPTHYFVDRKGIVKQVYTGILNQKQIENIMSGL